MNPDSLGVALADSLKVRAGLGLGLSIGIGALVCGLIIFMGWLGSWYSRQR